MYLNSYSTPSSLWLACSLSVIKFPLIIYDSRHGSRDKGGIQCNAGQRLKDTSVCPKKIASLIFTKKSSPYSLALEQQWRRCYFSQCNLYKKYTSHEDKYLTFEFPARNRFVRQDFTGNVACLWIYQLKMSVCTNTLIWHSEMQNWLQKCKCIRTNSYFQKSKLFERVL